MEMLRKKYDWQVQENILSKNEFTMFDKWKELSGTLNFIE